MKLYERVISDFGGYEKCKDILSQHNIGFIMNAEALRRHMLEYRRQHIAIDAYQRVKFTGFVLLLILTNKRLKTLHSKL